MHFAKLIDCVNCVGLLSYHATALGVASYANVQGRVGMPACRLFGGTDGQDAAVKFLRANS